MIECALVYTIHLPTRTEPYLQDYVPVPVIATPAAATLAGTKAPFYNHLSGRIATSWEGGQDPVTLRRNEGGRGELLAQEQLAGTYISFEKCQRQEGT